MRGEGEGRFVHCVALYNGVTPVEAKGSISGIELKDQHVMMTDSAMLMRAKLRVCVGLCQIRDQVIGRNCSSSQYGRKL